MRVRVAYASPRWPAARVRAGLSESARGRAAVRRVTCRTAAERVATGGSRAGVRCSAAGRPDCLRTADASPAVETGARMRAPKQRSSEAVNRGLACEHPVHCFGFRRRPAPLPLSGLGFHVSSESVACEPSVPLQPASELLCAHARTHAQASVRACVRRRRRQPGGGDGEEGRVCGRGMSGRRVWGGGRADGGRAVGALPPVPYQQPQRRVRAPLLPPAWPPTAPCVPPFAGREGGRGPRRLAHPCSARARRLRSPRAASPPPLSAC